VCQKKGAFAEIRVTLGEQRLIVERRVPKDAFAEIRVTLKSSKHVVHHPSIPLMTMPTSLAANRSAYWRWSAMASEKETSVFGWRLAQ
jgi:hypothetical protein